jgi:hypothetical protein
VIGKANCYRSREHRYWKQNIYVNKRAKKKKSSCCPFSGMLLLTRPWRTQGASWFPGANCPLVTNPRERATLDGALLKKTTTDKDFSKK